MDIKEMSPFLYLDIGRPRKLPEINRIAMLWQKGASIMIQKILIVDDSPISRKMLKSCLSKEREFQIVEAGDGLQGLEMFKEHRPDLTFMDLTMPVMDGVRSLDEIMKFDKDATVIVCTADVQIKSIKRVLELGAFHIVKKPPTKDNVLKALTMAEESKRGADVG